MDWKIFVITILVIATVFCLGLMYICGKFDLFDKEDFNGGKKEKNKSTTKRGTNEVNVPTRSNKKTGNGVKNRDSKERGK